MATNQLRQYITEARKSGMSNQDIIEALTKSGWHVHDIIDIVVDFPPKETGAAVISVRNVSKHFGKVKALDGVTLDIPSGQVIALLGPNGAGKTTLVRILGTLSQPTEGTVTIAGLDVVKDAQELRAIIGLTGQYAAVDEILSGRENLDMVGQLYHLPIEEACKRTIELLKEFDLEDAADRSVKTYSGGMRRRLDLAASLVIRPKVLFLDEPTTGLDPRSRLVMWNVIRDLVQGGTTVLLTTQYMEEADQLAHHIFVIDHGKIIAQGTSDELKRQVGGDVLELHLAEHKQVSQAAELIKSFGSAEPRFDSNTGIVTMSVQGGATVLVDVVRQLDTANVKISDVILRRPSLDDVFIKLTGHSAQ
ncbi:MAG: ATP-binding cassette domain-containing protein [bacterium]|nr:ATP-binding cassette domain-containing protein [bacterium]